MRPLASLLALALLAPAALSQNVVTLAPTADTHLQDINPNANFGASETIWFGRGSFFGLGNVRTLVGFNLSSLPQDPLAIKSATFSAWQHSTEAAAGGLPCELHAATAAWTEAGATWNNQPAYDNRVWSSADVGDSFHTGWIDWDATALVREHLSGALPNFGWLFRMQFETAGASRLGYFHSREHVANPTLRLKLTVELYGMKLTHGPLVAGQTGTLQVSQAEPGRNVFFAASTTGLGTHGVPQLGVTLELDQPRLLAQATANGAGQASISGFIPPVLSGRSIWLQAAADGELSNVASVVVL